MYHCRGYYESDRSRLGQGLPKPKIKHAKKIGETLIHKLSWGDEAGGEWLEDDLIETLSENLTSRAQMWVVILAKAATRESAGTPSVSPWELSPVESLSSGIGCLNDTMGIFKNTFPQKWQKWLYNENVLAFAHNVRCPRGPLTMSHFKSSIL